MWCDTIADLEMINKALVAILSHNAASTKTKGSAVITPFSRCIDVDKTVFAFRKSCVV